METHAERTNKACARYHVLRLTRRRRSAPVPFGSLRLSGSLRAQSGARARAQRLAHCCVCVLARCAVDLMEPVGQLERCAERRRLLMVELKTVNKDLRNERMKRRRLVIKTQARVRERGLGAWALGRLGACRCLCICLCLCLCLCLLPVAFCLLPFAFCLLPFAFCLLPVAARARAATGLVARRSGFSHRQENSSSSACACSSASGAACAR